MKYHKWAFIFPILAVLIWSLNIVVTRYVSDYISPVSISFYRWLIAFIILTPFMFLSVWRQRRLVIPYLPKLAVLSAFGMVLYQGLAYTAAHYTSATNMGIVNAFIPIFTIFVSLAILKDVPNRFAVFGSILSFAGLLYVMSQGNINKLLSGGGHLGDALMIIAVFLCILWSFLKEMAASTSNHDKLIRSDWVFRAVPSSFNFLVWSGCLKCTKCAKRNLCRCICFFNCAVSLDVSRTTTWAK